MKGETTMEKFKEILKGKITERVTDGEVVFNSMMKNNGLELEAVTIKRTNENITPVLYLESYFEQYKNGRNIDDIAVEIIEILMSHRQKENFDLQKLLSDENIKENVYFRIINKKRNKELLKDVPHMTYESLAMIIAINVNNLVKDEDEGEASIVIHNIYMERLHYTKEELFTYAKQNTPRLFPVWRKSLQELFPTLPPCEAVENTLVLTNQSKLYGAGTIFYKDVLRETAEILRADRLVILPSSIHEVLVLKQNTDSESKFYREMVQNVNYEAVRRDEVLDDTYYLYDKKTDRIKVC